VTHGPEFPDRERFRILPNSPLEIEARASILDPNAQSDENEKR